MKIYFCDECNESIPLNDIKTNRITIDAGKIYCQRCAPKPQRAPSSVNLPTIAVGFLLCLAIVAVVVSVWGDRILPRETESLSDRVTSLSQSLIKLREKVDEDVSDIRGDLELTEGLNGMGKLAQVCVLVRENADAMQKLRHSFNSLADDLRTGQDLHKHEVAKDWKEFQSAVDTSIKNYEKLAADLDKIVARLDETTERVSRLDDRVENVAAIRTVGYQPAPGAGKPPADDRALSPSDQERLDDALERLKSSEPVNRYTAVVDLLEIKSRSAEEAMLTVLRNDEEADYVQTAALDNLRKMKAVWTIPHIVKKLVDENNFIREAAIEALEDLMGRSIGLDPEAPKSKRLAKVRELEGWWTENQARVLGT